MIQRIIAMADNSFHEESIPSLAERLCSGTYGKDKTTEGIVEYLKINGDGCCGQRVFIRTPKGEFYLLEEDWEDETDSLMLYQPESKEWITCSTDVPKSLMADDTLSGYWISLQQWLHQRPRSR